LEHFQQSITAKAEVEYRFRSSDPGVCMAKTPATVNQQGLALEKKSAHSDVNESI
jgi:hypothetical protein